jgi:hypothetical protein
MNTTDIRKAADPITKDNVCVEEQHFKRQTQYNFKKRKCHVSHDSPVKKKTFLSVIMIKKIPVCCNPTLGLNVRMQLTLPKVGKWSPPGLPKI